LIGTHRFPLTVRIGPELSTTLRAPFGNRNVVEVGVRRSAISVGPVAGLVAGCVPAPGWVTGWVTGWDTAFGGAGGCGGGVGDNAALTAESTIASNVPDRPIMIRRVGLIALRYKIMRARRPNWWP
jgi:hypothetical protein